MGKIIIKNLTFAYAGSDKVILNGLNMDVNEGDFVCILGQSGCGKSTFLRLLGGLEKPTDGEITVDGKPVKGAGLDRSIVFQDYGLFPWMTVGENMLLALQQRYKDKKKSELVEIARDMLGQVGLADDTYGKYPKALSGGMKQRCAIARSFSIDPPILLMDEPFGALDAVTRSRLQKMVYELWQKEEIRKTVFFITHDIDEALILGTKIYVLGQAPSRILYQCEISPEKRPTGEAIYSNPEIIKIRHHLMQCINNDIAEQMEGNYEA